MIVAVAISNVSGARYQTLSKVTVDYSSPRGACAARRAGPAAGTSRAGAASAAATLGPYCLMSAAWADALVLVRSAAIGAKKCCGARPIQNISTTNGAR